MPATKRASGGDTRAAPAAKSGSQFNALTMVGYDTNGDGRVDSLDTNGDGNIDALVLPANGKKKTQLETSNSMAIKISAAVMLAVQGYDTNGDGLIDHLDTNGDGKIDSQIVPNAPAVHGGGGASQKRGHDGTLIAVGYDTNMDGRVDCLDTNGDGEIDAKVVALTSARQGGGPEDSKIASKVLLSAAVTLSIVGYDTNGDGQIDHLDTNGDGKIDSQIVPYSEGGSDSDSPSAGAAAAPAPAPASKASAGDASTKGSDGAVHLPSSTPRMASKQDAKVEPNEFEPSAKKFRRGKDAAAHPLAHDMRHVTLMLPVNGPGNASERMQPLRSEQPPNRVDSTGFWKVAWNEEYNSWYWWNTRTRETSWDDRLKKLQDEVPIKTEPSNSSDGVPLRVIRNDIDEGCDLYAASDWLDYCFSLVNKAGHKSDDSAASLARLKRTMYAELQIELISRTSSNGAPPTDFVRSGHMIMLVRDSPDVPVLVRERIVDVVLRDMARDRRRESDSGRGDYRQQPAASGGGSGGGGGGDGGGGGGGGIGSGSGSGGGALSQPSAWELLTKHFEAKDEAGLKLNPEQLAERLRRNVFDPSARLELEQPIVTGLTEMFRRKRPYLVTIARQLVCDEVRTADYNEAKQLGLLQQQRTQADGGEPEDASFGNASVRGPKLPKVKCVEQVNRLELERMHLAQQCDPEPPKLTTDDLLRISAACCLTLEETRSWFQNKNRGSVPGRARGKPKGTKDIRITLPPRLEEWKGMEIKTWQR